MDNLKQYAFNLLFKAEGSTGKQIYLDNAATTRISRKAFEAMKACMDENWGNPSSLYALGRQAAGALQSAREHIAVCINASPKEIIFTSGGSEADNQAICSAARIGAQRGKRHIISTAIEHHAVLHTLERLDGEGFEVTLLEVPEDGLIRPEQVEQAIREDTCLVSVMFANNEIGTVQPVAEIGALCRAKGVLFHTDAVQAAGHVPIDIQAQRIDLLALSAHKFHGPRGVGVLYARQGIPLTSLIEGGAQERGKRAGTENLPAIAGMAAALEEACGQMEENAVKVSALRDRLIAGLADIPRSMLNGDPNRRLPGNVNFCFEGIEGESLALLLDRMGVCVSSGSACASGSADPSHVLLSIGRPWETARGAIRLTLSEETTTEDIDNTVLAVSVAVEQLRSMSPEWRGGEV